MISGDNQLQAIRESGKMLSEVLKKVIAKTEIGITTKDIAIYAANEINKLGGEPAFYNYQGYPDVICISINENIVHGIPNRYRIKNGDIVKYDCGVRYRGMNTDAARTVIVGDCNERVKLLVKTTKLSLNKAVSVVRPGAHIGDIGETVQRTLEKPGFGVIRDLVGHGVGKTLHEAPNIPNYGLRGQGPIIQENQALAIEPMSSMGSYKLITLADGWTISTADKSLSAHFEDTVLVTKNGAEILTR
jgi:methionyl aminopeptidase